MALISQVDIWLFFIAHKRIHVKTDFFQDTFPEAIYPANMHLKIGNVLDPIPFSTKFDFAQIR